MNTKNDKATPRLWRIYSNDLSDIAAVGHDGGKPPILKTTKANAALIVQAVNERDALLAVAEAARAFVSSVPLASMSATQLALRQDFTTALAHLATLREGKE